MTIRMIAAGIIALGLFACEAETSKNSDLEHTFGKTRREPGTALTNCKGNFHADEIPAASAYIKTLAEKIAAANPKTFNGPYALNKFCFTVVKSSMVNASADPSNGQVTFNSQLLLALNTDAAVAAVLGHEMAHITMQHKPTLEHEKIANNPTWIKENTRISQLLTQLSDEMEATQKRMQALNQEMVKLQSDMDEKVSPALKAERDNLHVEEQSLRNEMAALWTNKDLEPHFEILGQLFNGMPSARMRGALPALPEARAGEDRRLTSVRAKIETLRLKISDLNQREQAEHPDLWQSFQSSYQVMMSESTQLVKKMAEQGQLITQYHDQLFHLKESILGDETYNWREEEADDVGLELTIRAGFSPAHFPTLFETLLANSEGAEAVVKCQASLESNDSIARGKSTHPHSCYRIYNATILEMKDHKADYAELLTKATVVDLLPGKLQQLKAQLK